MAVTDSAVFETLQSAAAATGAGTPISLRGFRRLTVHVTGTFVGTVSFEGTVDDSAWFPVGLKTAADGAAVTSTTAPGAWKSPGDLALSQFRANVTSFTSGAITVRSGKEVR